MNKTGSAAKVKLSSFDTGKSTEVQKLNFKKSNIDTSRSSGIELQEVQNLNHQKYKKQTSTRMPPLRDTLSRRSKTSCNRSYSPLLCRSRKSVSLSWRDGPLSANSIFTPTPPMQKQYGFLTVCKNREMRSFRESALSKVIPLTSGRDSAATAPMSTLLICSSSCVVNFTVNLLRRLIERLPLFGGETQQASTTGMLACCLTPPWDTLSRGLL